MAILSRFGLMLLSIRNRSLINCGAYAVVPVTLVPGRSRLFTSPSPTGIVDGEHYYWNVGGCPCSSNSCWRIGGQDDVYFLIYKLSHQTLIISIKNTFAIFNPHILAINVSKFGQASF